MAVLAVVLLAASIPATAAPGANNAPNTSNYNKNPASGAPEAPDNDNGKHKFGFQDCGGAKACLGILRLERIRKRSGQGHKTVDQLSADLDKDKDLVSVSALAQSSSWPGLHAILSPA